MSQGLMCQHTTVTYSISKNKRLVGAKKCSLVEDSSRRSVHGNAVLREGTSLDQEVLTFFPVPSGTRYCSWHLVSQVSSSARWRQHLPWVTGILWRQC